MPGQCAKGCGSAYGLASRFFCGKPRRISFSPPEWLFAIFDLAGSEDAVTETITVVLERAFETRDIDDVNADADNHMLRMKEEGRQESGDRSQNGEGGKK